MRWHSRDRLHSRALSSSLLLRFHQIHAHSHPGTMPIRHCSSPEAHSSLCRRCHSMSMQTFTCRQERGCCSITWNPLLIGERGSDSDPCRHLSQVCLLMCGYCYFWNALHFGRVFHTPCTARTLGQGQPTALSSWSIAYAIISSSRP